jgi:predicted transcriptional regulator
MSYRMKITLPDAIASQLDELARTTGEPLARLAGQMVRDALADVAGAAHVRRSPRRGALVPADDVAADPDARALWLEPYGGDSEWRQHMWAKSWHCMGRYPTELHSLKRGWWESEPHVETLCARAVWRRWIDDACRDPREELNFQLHLADFGRKLAKEGGGVALVWAPGPPPDRWL